MEFKDRIKEVRKREHITAAKLAEMLDRSAAAIRMWEAGKATPDANMLIEIARLFHVTTDYLLGLEEESSPAEDIDLSEDLRHIPPIMRQPLIRMCYLCKDADAAELAVLSGAMLEIVGAYGDHW